MCLYPKLIKNPKYKNNPEAIRDLRTGFVPIACNNCKECYKKKATQWRIRLNEEIKNKDNGRGYFVTLTLSTESLQEIEKELPPEITGYNKDNGIVTYAVRHFLERWRKKFKKSLRHWFITELGHGETEHIHIHGLIWTKENFEEVRNIWKYGFVYPRKYQISKNYVNAKTINYIIKYCTKLDTKHKYYKPIILTSNGIGANAKISDYEKNKDKYRNPQGYEMAMPMYYRNKIYTEEERENKWIEKLDKGKRWINGREVDNNNIKLINKLLKQAQEESEAKGYIGDKHNWEEKQHENEQRELLREIRYKKVEKIFNLNLEIPNNEHNFEGKLFIKT
ncbi:MAG: putative replication initiation protein [Microviridae sp.]|nr:MAG: putative replication initiation protein [Microviridae sp.]